MSEIIKKCKEHRTSENGNEISIRTSIYKDKVAVTGIALDTDGKLIRATRVSKSTKISRESNLEYVKQQVQYRVETKLRNMLEVGNKKTTGKSKTAGLENDKLSQIFRELSSSSDPINPKWNDETRKSALTYFGRHVLPFLREEAESGAIHPDVERLRQEMLEDIRESTHASDITRKMQQTQHNHLRDSECIYEAMRRIDLSLPKVKFAQKRGKRIQAETIKSLPRSVRRAFSRELERRVKNEPKLVLGAVMMFDAGLRTAEAAAVWFDLDIELVGEIAVVNVCYQEKNGLRSEILKTLNGYRKIPLSYWGLTMLRRCNDSMSEQPLQENERAPLRKNELSAWVRELLFECGLTEAHFEAIQAEELENPDCDANGNPVYDICAYILRRDRCSRWRNICGLTQLEIDYYLGHKIAKKSDRASVQQTKERIETTAKKLERYIYDSSISRHPYYSPILLAENEKYDIWVPYTAIKLGGNRELRADITAEITACIPGEPITLIFDAQLSSVAASSSVCFKGLDDKPVIGSDWEFLKGGNGNRAD